MKLKTLIVLFSCVSAAVAERHNVLFISVDDLRPELRSFGANYIHSPAMDSLAAGGRAFTRHYVQAPLCGPSRYSMLMGKYADAPGLRGHPALFNEAKRTEGPPPSLPRVFRENGYRTVSIGKVSHFAGGLGGPEWTDESKPEMPGAWDVALMPTDPWKTPARSMHSYANGKTNERGVTPANEHVDGDDMTYTDGWIAREALGQMEGLGKSGEPFFLAVGLMKPHLPLACPKSYLEIYNGVDLPPIPHPDKPEGLNTWHSSYEFANQYAHAGRDPRTDEAYADEIRRSYAACVSYADAQVGKLLAKLEELGLADNTIVVLWGDHGWHLGEHSLYGKHTLYEESLLAPLVIRTPGMAKPGKKSSAITESVDIFPTLCELTSVPKPEGLSGISLTGHLKDPEKQGRPAIAYFKDKETVRTEDYRLIRHNRKGKAPEFELYDHSTDGSETKNLASEKPEIVKSLNEIINERIGGGGE